jgi:hypothetical protein
MELGTLNKVVELEINPNSNHADLERELALLMQQSFELFKRKNSSYGTDNIAALGVKGIFVRLWDKVNRLKTLVWFGGHNPLNDETISDTFQDISVYALIALLILKGSWPGCKSE